MKLVTSPFKNNRHIQNFVTTFFLFPMLFAVDIYYFKRAPNLHLSTYMSMPIFLLVTTFLHRYFSHRSFQLNWYAERVVAFLCAAIYQNDPAWWASVHRLHHQHSDTEQDVHSPHKKSLLEAGLLWPYRKGALNTDKKIVADLLSQRDLKFYNDYPYFAPNVLGAIVFWCFYIYFAFGRVSGAPFWSLDIFAQAYHMTLYAFLLPCITAFTYGLIANIIIHTYGYQNHRTNDHSKNSLLFGFIFMGEGWHNNHHKNPASPRSGEKWWQVDFTYYFIFLLKVLRLADFHPSLKHQSHIQS